MVAVPEAQQLLLGTAAAPLDLSAPLTVSQAATVLISRVITAGLYAASEWVAMWLRVSCTALREQRFLVSSCIVSYSNELICGYWIHNQLG